MTDEAMEVSALYEAVMDWAMSFGEENIVATPGLWHRRTEKIGGLGPIDVRINAQRETVEHVPPFAIKLSMDDYFPGLIGIIGPTGGALMQSRVDGEDEDGLIAHFKSQPVPQAA